jgi:hypothetical protein
MRGVSSVSQEEKEPGGNNHAAADSGYFTRTHTGELHAMFPSVCSMRR